MSGVAIWIDIGNCQTSAYWRHVSKINTSTHHTRIISMKGYEDRVRSPVTACALAFSSLPGRERFILQSLRCLRRTQQNLAQRLLHAWTMVSQVLPGLGGVELLYNLVVVGTVLAADRLSAALNGDDVEAVSKAFVARFVFVMWARSLGTPLSVVVRINRTVVRHCNAEMV